MFKSADSEEGGESQGAEALEALEEAPLACAADCCCEDTTTPPPALAPAVGVETEAEGTAAAAAAAPTRREDAALAEKGEVPPAPPPPPTQPLLCARDERPPPAAAGRGWYIFEGRRRREESARLPGCCCCCCAAPPARRRSGAASQTGEKEKTRRQSARSAPTQRDAKVGPRRQCRGAAARLDVQRGRPTAESFHSGSRRASGAAPKPKQRPRRQAKLGGGRGGLGRNAAARSLSRSACEVKEAHLSRRRKANEAERTRRAGAQCCSGLRLRAEKASRSSGGALESGTQPAAKDTPNAKTHWAGERLGPRRTHRTRCSPPPRRRRSRRRRRFLSSTPPPRAARLALVGLGTCASFRFLENVAAIPSPCTRKTGAGAEDASRRPFKLPPAASAARCFGFRKQRRRAESCNEKSSHLERLCLRLEDSALRGRSPRTARGHDPPHRPRPGGRSSTRLQPTGAHSSLKGGDVNSPSDWRHSVG